MAATVVLIVPERHVKSVKSALENFGHLDRKSKITSVAPEDGEASNPQATDVTFKPRFPVLKLDLVSGRYVDPAELDERELQEAAFKQQQMRIPTTIPYPLSSGKSEDTLGNQHDQELKFKILDDLVLSHLFPDTELTYQVLDPSQRPSVANQNPIQKALREALNSLPDSTHSIASLGLSTEVLVSSFPESYSLYKPMLLLPSNCFSSEPWKKLFSVHQAYSDYLRPVWQHLAEAVSATHVAVNAPIPRHTQQELQGKTQDNILRSPVNLGPLYGDFGPWPNLETLTSPKQSDFDSHLWVSTTQNGIHQTWAPRFTMFSRGNIGEKTRILNLPSVTMDSVSPSTAVDLYAGIGYFTFSYKKGGASSGKQGIKRVLCWELNPWSVEGLRRGAEINGWSCTIFTEDDMAETNVEALRKKMEQGKKSDFWIFQASNEHAERIVQLIFKEGYLSSPIRHVNLGLLPTSQPSWPTAMRIVSAEHGGWIHAHENVGVDDIECRTREVESQFQGLSDGHEGSRVAMEHVEKVKMYAPGVAHFVFDVHVTGMP